jgi:hypothetical protein
VVAFSPKRALDIPAGDYTLSVKVWLDQGRAVEKIHLAFENPALEIPIDLSGLERRTWVTIEQKIVKTEASRSNDQFRIEIRREDVPEIKAAKLLIDDIAIRKVVN